MANLTNLQIPFLKFLEKKLPFLSDGYQNAPTSYGPKRPTTKVNEASLQEK